MVSPEDVGQVNISMMSPLRYHHYVIITLRLRHHHAANFTSLLRYDGHVLPFLGNSNAKVAIKAAMDRDPKLHVTIPFDVSM